MARSQLSTSSKNKKSPASSASRATTTARPWRNRFAARTSTQSLMALNAAQSANPIAQRKMEPIPAFEQSALPVALQKNMGILSMKVMGQGMLVGTGAGRASPAELLQFNLSQPVASVVIGCEQMAPLEQNVQAAMNFTPISESAKQRLQQKVAPSRSAWQNFLRTHEDTAAV